MEDLVGINNNLYDVFAASLLGGVACKSAVPMRLEERLPAAFNAFCGNNEGCSFWGILGDYFYDQGGAANRNFMNRVSDDTKKRAWVGTPGNHDLWMFGGPSTSNLIKGSCYIDTTWIFDTNITSHG